MSEIDILRLLEKSVFLSKGTRIQRLSKSPVKVLNSKILEIIALWLRKPFLMKTKTFWGEEMLVIIPESVSVSIYRYGLFEEGLTRIVLKYLKPGMTFFDVGAHFGYFTLLSSIIVGNSGQVHSFEPTPSTFEILKANVSKKQNVSLNNCAVLSKRKNVFLNDYGVRYSAYNSIYEARLPKKILTKLETNKYQVQSISIDDYIDTNDVMPDFIKIDAESSEHEILLGMEKTIQIFRPIISIEVGDINVNRAPGSRELMSSIIKKGYDAHKFGNGGILPHYFIHEKYQYDNVLFLPRQK